MKSVLISIHPKWCELIASGKKTVEVRKTRPKIEVPFKCYIYETKGKTDFPTFIDEDGHEIYEGRGQVIGEFVCDCIANYEAELWDDETFERIQEFFEPDDFAEYGEYEYKTIADNGDDFWKENMLCTSSCLTIEELRKYLGSGFSEFYGWHISDLVIYDKPKELREFYKKCKSYDKDEYDIDNLDCIECENPCANGGKLYLKRPPQSWCYVEKGGAEE